MYTVSEKPSRNNNPNRAAKPYESKRWDRGGYEQLQAEQEGKYRNDEKGDRNKKQRKPQDDNTMISDVLVDSQQKNKQERTMNKWQHVILT